MISGEINAIALRDGSYSTHAGFAGDDAPNVVYINRESAGIVDKSNKGLMSPNWDAIEKNWRYALHKLNVDLIERQVLLSDSPNSSLSNRVKTVEYFLENLSTRAVFIEQSTLLPLYSIGRTTGLILDCGYQNCFASPVYEGLGFPKCSMRQFDMGGSHIVNALKEKFSGLTYDDELLDAAAKVVADASPDSTSATSYLLPDGTQIGKQNLVEAFFDREKRSITHNRTQISAGIIISNTIQECVIESIFSTPIDIRKDLLKNIYVFGGCSMITRFDQRLSYEAKKLLSAKAAATFNVIALPERKYSEWIGLSVLASMSSFQAQWITKAQFDEYGIEIVRKWYWSEKPPAADYRSHFDEEVGLATQNVKTRLNRGKIALYGDSNAGKSALIRSLKGEKFENTKPTMGIEEHLMEVNFADLGSGSWREFKKPEKLLEAAMAQIFHNAKLKEPSFSTAVERYDYSHLPADFQMPSFPAEAFDISIEKFYELLHITNKIGQEYSEWKLSTENNNKMKKLKFLAGYGDNGYRRDVNTALAAEPHENSRPIRNIKSGEIICVLTKTTNNYYELADGTGYVPSIVEGAKWCGYTKRWNHPIYYNRVNAVVNDQTFRQTSYASTVTSTLEDSSVSCENRISDSMEINTSYCDEKYYDENYVATYLSDRSYVSPKLSISILEFGGAQAFNVIHHLFISSYSISVIVFSMARFLSNKEACLQNLNECFNSIVSHAYDNGTMAHAKPRIVFVGTYKDKVSDFEAHEIISNSLCEEFSKKEGWELVLKYERKAKSSGNVKFNYFPIDNTLSYTDPDLKHLIQLFETYLANSEVVNDEKPLSWLKCIDALNSEKVSSLSLRQVCKITNRCNMNYSETLQFLRYMNKTNVLMWLDQDRLRDVVILDPFKNFVPLAAAIISKFAQSEYIIAMTEAAIKRQSRLLNWDESEMMARNGVIADSLLAIILKEYNNNIPQTVRLMIKYDLLTPVISTASANESTILPSVEEYFAPALFPEVNNITLTTNSRVHSCYIFFSTSNNACQQRISTSAELRRSGILPPGLFQRLIAKVINWSQITSMSSIKGKLFKSTVTLHYGSQHFTLTTIPNHNAIRLDVDGKSPFAVHNRVLEQVRLVILECMVNLKFTTLLLASEQSFVSINVLSAHVSQQQPLRDENGSIVLDLGSSISLLGKWIQPPTLLDFYDMFISSHCNTDSTLPLMITDRCTIHPVLIQDHLCRPLSIFYGPQNLPVQDKREFTRDFSCALLHSTMFVPLFSVNCLIRINEHDTSTIDYTLLEWILAIVSFDVKGNIKTIFPVKLGDPIDSSAHNGLRQQFAFDENILYDAVPIETIRKSRELFRANSVDISSLSDQLDSWTIRYIVRRILKFGGYSPTSGLQLWVFVAETCKKASAALKEVLTNESYLLLAPTTASVGPTSSALQTGVDIAKLVEMVNELRDEVKEFKSNETDLLSALWNQIQEKEALINQLINQNSKLVDQLIERDSQLKTKDSQINFLLEQLVEKRQISADGFTADTPDRSISTAEGLTYKADCLGLRVPIRSGPAQTQDVIGYVKHGDEISLRRTIQNGYHQLENGKGWLCMSTSKVKWTSVTCEPPATALYPHLGADSGNLNALTQNPLTLQESFRPRTNSLLQSNSTISQRKLSTDQIGDSRESL